MRHSWKEDRLISQRLKRHEELTQMYIEEGMTRTDASSKAFKQVLQERIR